MPMASPFLYQRGFPNMEPSSAPAPATTAKRGPEDDVQFVAAHPVKKCRGSRDQPQKPAVDKTARGTSLPTMDNFAFPPLDSHAPSQTSQSSPLLSPRQLPTSVMPHLASHFPSPPTGFAPFLPPTVEQRPVVGGHQEPSKSPEGTKGADFSWPLHNDVHTDVHTDQPRAPMVMPSPSMPEPPPAVHTEPWSWTMPQATTNAGHDMSSNPPQESPSKLPCLACEQSRHHAIFSRSNAYLARHQPQVQVQYPWHGPGGTQHQMQMGHPLPAPMGSGSPANHAPLGYLLPSQLAPQMPMTLTRPLTAAGMPGSASLQGLLGQNQGQQISPGQVPPLPPTYPQHLMPSHYLPPPLSSFQQPLMMPRSLVASSLVAPIQAPVAPPQTSPTASEAPASTLPEPPNHSPNLIVDIAETCEDLFPWEEVAQRHNVPRQKVVETFSAVVQLPLLRCTTDKRRHGNLATSRLRQYTKAKRDVEAAKALSSPSPPSPSPTATATASNQTQSHGDRAVLPAVWDMANTMAPLSLPSSIANGLAGAWPR